MLRIPPDDVEHVVCADPVQPALAAYPQPRDLGHVHQAQRLKPLLRPASGALLAWWALRAEDVRVGALAAQLGQTPKACQHRLRDLDTSGLSVNG